MTGRSSTKQHSKNTPLCCLHILFWERAAYEIRIKQPGPSPQKIQQDIAHPLFPDLDAAISAAADQQLADTLNCSQLCYAVSVHQVLHPQLAAQVRAAVWGRQAGALAQTALLNHRHTSMHVAAVAVHMSWDLNRETEGQQSGKKAAGSIQCLLAGSIHCSGNKIRALLCK
jgi:hypothetical protein